MVLLFITIPLLRVASRYIPSERWFYSQQLIALSLNFQDVSLSTYFSSHTNTGHYLPFAFPIPTEVTIISFLVVEAKSKVQSISYVKTFEMVELALFNPLLLSLNTPVTANPLEDTHSSTLLFDIPQIRSSVIVSCSKWHPVLNPFEGSDTLAFRSPLGLKIKPLRGRLFV